ncbi:MAG: cation-transporting P-type ATPase [Deltaproteobacteria bacterium]|nr:cation-transporting P-type ATPase [Deltaproteobacteria bacterium]
MVELRSLSPDAALRELGSSPGGLTSDEVARRLARHGPNRPPPARRRIGPSLLAQLTHFMALLLWVGGAAGFAAGMPELGGAIWLVNVINGAFAYWQEHRAERATQALLDLIPQVARVLRDGEQVEVQAVGLVPGDILVLSEGDRISADALVLEAAGLQVTEAALTGESEPVAKDALPAPDDSASLSAGTAVLRGTGLALVVATGAGTRLGAIARATLAVGESASPLQKELARATRKIAAIAVGVGVFFFVLSLAFTGMGLGQGIVFSLGMIVAFVPEGLLPTVTLALALSTQRMARRKALVRRLSAVETLGATSVICTDKTGTLTQNEMSLVEAIAADVHLTFEGAGYAPDGIVRHRGEVVTAPPDRATAALFEALVRCNDARLVPPDGADGARWSVLGDPTEGAMRVAAARLGIDDVHVVAPRLGELPFDSEVRRMSTLHAADGEVVLYCKGAPGEVVQRSLAALGPDGEVALDEARRAALLADADALASRGLRVLGAAKRRLPALPDLGDRDAIERDLVFLGLVGLHDPPRPEVPPAIARCHEAGIRIVMLTGDHPLAAEHIARELGLVRGETVRVVTGGELEGIADQDLPALLASEVVFARTRPEQKLRIVDAFQRLGHVVAVTGDGVNDAPALRKADIGVAMGRSGTDVARESADMVLLDDNFASIVAAVEEGRAVYANIKKFTSYIFTSNVPEALPFILFALSAGSIPLALAVMHILAIDLGTDLFPALALAGEPPERDAMHRPPRRSSQHIIDGALLTRAYLFLGVIQALAVMAAFYAHYWLNGHWGQWLDLPGEGAIYRQATAMALAAVVMTQIGNLLAHRTELISSLRAGRNRLLIPGIAAELVMLLLFIHVPPLADLIGVEPFPASQWLVLLTLVPLLFVADELRKAIARRTRRLALRARPG